MTRRRWIADTWDAYTARLTGDQASHLARVLRAKPGQQFDVVAGGHLFLAKIASVSPEEVVFDLMEEHTPDHALPLVLLLAVSKFDRMEWALEKATELGIARIVPVIARRTEAHLAKAAPKRHERWQKIVREAAKQSRRSDIPAIEEPAPLANALAQVPTIAAKILLSEMDRETPLLSALTTTTPGLEHWLAVGTEGGWTAEEMQLFSDSGWLPVTLGPRILRVETAAIAAIAAISAEWLRDATPEHSA